MTVDGDKFSRLPDTMLSDVQPTVGEVSSDYGRLTQTFGSVTAVAPPTMTVLNTTTTPTDPYDGMPAADAFKLLCGSLSDPQWHLLTSEAGLGQADLSDQQRPLWAAVVPSGETATLPKNGGSIVFLKEDELSRTKLRLAQWIGMMVPEPGSLNAWAGSNSRLTPVDGKPQYTIQYSLASNHSMTGHPATCFGVILRDIVPNAPKPSDFDYHSSIMETQIPLAEIRTVGELIRSIATAIHLEMYTDRRYEKHTVTFSGPATASAGDLLRALAFCVCGTYREVGPTYVLTNDRIGLGTRRIIPQRLAQAAAAERKTQEEAAADWIITQHAGIRDLPTLDGLDITDAERALASPLLLSDTLPSSLEVPWTMLTPRQQELAMREFQGSDPTHAMSRLEQAKTSGKFRLERHAVLQLLCPTIPEPVELSDSLTRSLFEPSESLRRDLSRPQQKALDAMIEAARKTAKPEPSLQDLVSHLAAFPRRAVFARPRTAEELDTLLGAMKRLGLNQLWLDVFSQGKIHTDGPRNLLTEALSKTKGTNITVIPTVEMLNWDSSAPAEARDYNIFGETPPLQGGSLPVCPASPSVLETLTNLVRKIAATPGVYAIGLRNTVMPDYEEGNRVWAGSDTLGYAPSLRLSFLRRWHVDPIDVDLYQGNSQLSVPEFDDADAMQGVNEAWNQWRSASDIYLMQQILDAARQGAKRQFPLLVQKRGQNWDTYWYGLWADPSAPLPHLTSEGISSAQGDFARFAHQQSALAFYTPNPFFGMTRQLIINILNGLKPGWDGIVLDGGSQPTDKALDSLVKNPPLSSPKVAGH